MYFHMCVRLSVRLCLCPHPSASLDSALPHGFSKHAREQYEKLSTMHKNMQKLYENMGSFYAFDPHTLSVEDFFGELANFRTLFMVSGAPDCSPISLSLSLLCRSVSLFLSVNFSVSLSLSLLLSRSLSLCLSLSLYLSLSLSLSLDLALALSLSLSLSLCVSLSVSLLSSVFVFVLV